MSSPTPGASRVPKVRSTGAPSAEGCLGLVVFVVLAAAAFYWFEIRDPWANQGVAVSKPATGTAEPSPAVPEPENGGMAEIAYDLQRKVIEGAGVTRQTSVECELAEVPDSAQDFGCTVTYDGIDVPYTVSITDVTTGLGMAVFQWDAKSEKAILTREGAFAGFWRDASPTGATDLRCDDGIPEKKLVPMGRTGFYCYSTTDRGDHHRVEVAQGEHGLFFEYADD
ncbi:hypothetical protein ABN028_01590 [Actinopolymorpha sp. B17G11]|uniref:hypothetical protein n=1 Tax=Actinopolymorpha sp. B17G11 TaxID=3160861 RepID=UPI0032E3F6B8